MNSSAKSRPRSGRPLKASNRNESAIVRQTIQDPHLSSNEINCRFSNLNLSSRTIRQIQFTKGLKSFRSRAKPLFTKRMVRNRIQFAKKYKNQGNDFWDRVFYADESYIDINPSSIMNLVRRFPTTNPYSPLLARKTIKHPMKVMIWSCFNSYGIGRIHICEGSMASEKYK